MGSATRRRASASSPDDLQVHRMPVHARVGEMAKETTWDGSANLHDLGGLPRATGGSTARGRVWRSGRPESVSEEGWREARESGLVLRIDLRNPGEGRRRPEDPLVDESVMPAAIDCPLEDAHDPNFLKVCGPVARSPARVAGLPHPWRGEISSAVRSDCGCTRADPRALFGRAGSYRDRFSPPAFIG